MKSSALVSRGNEGKICSLNSYLTRAYLSIGISKYINHF